MLANMSEEEWDAVIRVHLKGHFAPLRHAAAYWRDEFKAGNAVDARIINTSSAAGLQGSVGQGNYAAAKAGIATLTLQAAAEMGRYGITVNAIAPAARTRMTEAVFAETMAKPEDGAFDAMAPENVSPLVVWLGSPGRVRSPARCSRSRPASFALPRAGRMAPGGQGSTLGPKRIGPRGHRPAGQGPHAGSGLRLARLTLSADTPCYDAFRE